MADSPQALRAIADIEAQHVGVSMPARGFELNDTGNAERFVVEHGENVRYCADWSKFFTWTPGRDAWIEREYGTGESERTKENTGGKWAIDNIGQVELWAKETLRNMKQTRPPSALPDLAFDAHYKASMQSRGRSAMLNLVQCEPPIPVRPDAFDQDIMLFNCRNGTIDLRTGEFRPARREDLITKMAAVDYDPEATAPATITFVHQIFDGNQEVIDYVWRAAGYSLTGDTSERAVFLLLGKPAAGKSTLIKLLHLLFGDYAVRLPVESLMQQRNGGGIPNDIARLRGARFVSVSETDEDRRMSEVKLKELTGNDVVSARFMRAEYFDFEPTHKFWIGTNHPPKIRDSSGATWDRIRLLNFAHSLPKEKQDPYLLEALKSELPGILNLLLKGLAQWRDGWTDNEGKRQTGLGRVAAVEEATAAARHEQDQIERFIDEACIRGGSDKVENGEFYRAYKHWCEEGREGCMSQVKLGKIMRGKEYELPRSGSSRFWGPLRLVHAGHAPNEEGSRQRSDAAAESDDRFNLE